MDLCFSEDESEPSKFFKPLLDQWRSAQEQKKAENDTNKVVAFIRDGDSAKIACVLKSSLTQYDVVDTRTDSHTFSDFWEDIFYEWTAVFDDTIKQHLEYWRNQEEDFDARYAAGEISGHKSWKSLDYDSVFAHPSYAARMASPSD